MKYFFWFREVIPEKLVFIIHETPGARFSLIPGDSLRHKTIVEYLVTGQAYMLGLIRSSKILAAQKGNLQCKEYDKDDSQEKCYIEKVLAQKYSDFESTRQACLSKGINVTNKCVLPQALNILEFVKNQTDVVQMNQCTTFDEYDCMVRETLVTLPKLRDEKCPKPCSQFSLEKITKNIPSNDGTSLVQLYYADNYMTLYEEYLIFDLNSIVGLIGGSLGLFLGFSFLQCGDFVLHSFEKILKSVITKFF